MKIQVTLKSDMEKRYFLHEDLCPVLIIQGTFLLGMKNVSDKRSNEN